MTNASVEESFIGELERGLTEFFAAQTTNERKKEIEQQLQTLKARQDNLHFSLQLLHNSSNPYVVWFACATLADVAVPQRWASLADDHALQARKFVMDFLVKSFAGLERFLQAKAALVLVAIAKVDWPQRYPNFLEEVEALAVAPQQQMLGLSLLLLTVEEMAQGGRRTLMTSQRKAEVEALIRTKLGEICLVLNEVLKGQLRLAVGERNDIVCSLCFEVFLQVCAAFHPNHFLQQELVEVCFQFAMQWQSSSSHSIEALKCINEILEKRYIPKAGNYDSFISSIATHILQLLQSICSANSETAAALDEELTGQFSRFLQVFVQVHLRRLDSGLSANAEEFPVQHFLSILLVYTSVTQRQAQTLAEVHPILQCLDVWELVLDRVDLLIQEPSAAAHKLLRLYLEGLVAAMDHLVTLLLWKQSGALLKELSESITAFNQLRSRSITLIARIALTAPDPGEDPGQNALERVGLGPGLEKLLTRVFAELQESLGKVNTDVVAGKDCATLFMVASRVAPSLAMPWRFNKSIEGTWKLLEWAFQVVEHCNGQKSFMQGAHLVDLQSNAFALLAGLAGWLAQASRQLQAGQSLSTGNGTIPALAGLEPFNQLVSGILSQSIMVLDTTISPPPEALMDSGISVLASLSRTTVPLTFLSFPPVQALVNSLEKAVVGIPVAPAQSLAKALSEAVFSSVASSERHNKARVEEAKQIYINMFRWAVEAITRLANGQTVTAAQTSRKYFMILSALTTSVRTQGTFEKKLVAAAVLPALKPTINLLLQFLTQASKNPNAAKASGALSGARDAFDMVISAYDSLLNQMSKEEAESTATTLVSFVQGQNVPELMRSTAGTGGVMLILKLIQFLTVLVGSPKSFDGVADALCNIIFGQLGVVLTWTNSSTSGGQEETMVDVREHYYKLIHALLRSRWRWFFTRVSAKADMVNSRSFVSEARQKSFVQAMEIFLRSLRDETLPPASFKANILVFDDLNKTHNLYTVAIFRAEMLPAFTETLLDLVRLKGHEICEEEIVQTIFGLAAVDFPKFFNEIMPKYASKLSGGMQGLQLQQDTNAPTFCANIRRLMHDLALVGEMASAR